MTGLVAANSFPSQTNNCDEYFSLSLKQRIHSHLLVSLPANQPCFISSYVMLCREFFSLFYACVVLQLRRQVPIVFVALVMLTANCFVMDVSETRKTRVAAIAPVAARGLHSSSPTSAGGYDYLHAKFVLSIVLAAAAPFLHEHAPGFEANLLVLLLLRFFLFHHTQVHVQPAIQAGQQAESCCFDMYVPHV
jgi:hypothetical protein